MSLEYYDFKSKGKRPMSVPKKEMDALLEAWPLDLSDLIGAEIPEAKCRRLAQDFRDMDFGLVCLRNGPGWDIHKRRPSESVGVKENDVLRSQDVGYPVPLLALATFLDENAKDKTCLSVSKEPDARTG